MAVKKSKLGLSAGGRSMKKEFNGIPISISVKWPHKPMGRMPSGGKHLKAYLAALKEAQAREQEGKANQIVPQNSLDEHLSNVEDEQEVPLSAEEILALVEERFDTLSEIVDAACQGAFHAVIVSGAAGVGKTFSVEQIVKKYADEGEVTAEFVSGVVSPVHFYKMLHDNSAPNAIIVMDDADNLFGNEDSLNLLKAALDTKKERRINWRTNSHMLKEDGIPNSFLFEGAIIFITNLDFQAIVDADKKMSPHMAAFMSRAQYIDLMIHHRDHVALWVKHRILTDGILVNDKFSGMDEDEANKMQNEVVEFLMKHKYELRELSIRTALKIGDLVNTMGEKWESRARITQLRASAKPLKMVS